MCFSLSSADAAKCIGTLVLRVTFGLSLTLVGLAHYMTLGDTPATETAPAVMGFVSMTAEGLGPLSKLGAIWAYILPGLMIAGGLLLALKTKVCLGSLLSGVALGSIAVGMLLKAVVGGAGLGYVMPASNNALIWLLVYIMVVKCCTDTKDACCSKNSSPEHEDGCCGSGSCK